ncbi:MAG: MerR family transcriptional regulator [Deltaproteobacteria bacterium]|nr:MerR family transcriptional regulator [Deltaproteobacteria bacterium]
MKENFEKTYSIGDASRMTGVSQRKLRSWEGKYIPEPERLVCGERAYRRYTQAEINLIQGIREYQDQGFTLCAGAKKANEDLARKGGMGNA